MLGTKVLSRYLKTKKGNCVSMPILFLILADRLGLDVSLATAPDHILIKLTVPESGKTYNVETTSGAGFARDAHYVNNMGTTWKGIDNGIFLRKLSRRETAAVIVHFLGEYYSSTNRFEDMSTTFRLTLTHDPRSVYSMLKLGTSYYHILKRDYHSRYKSLREIPSEDRPHFFWLLKHNKYFFDKAISLGWRDPIEKSAQHSTTANKKG